MKTADVEVANTVEILVVADEHAPAKRAEPPTLPVVIELMPEN